MSNHERWQIVIVTLQILVLHLFYVYTDFKLYCNWMSNCCFSQHIPYPNVYATCFFFFLISTLSHTFISPSHLPQSPFISHLLHLPPSHFITALLPFTLPYRWSPFADDTFPPLTLHHHRSLCKGSLPNSPSLINFFINISIIFLDFKFCFGF